jgi:hypothetical protein
MIPCRCGLLPYCRDVMGDVIETKLSPARLLGGAYRVLPVARWVRRFDVCNVATIDERDVETEPWWNH